MEKYINEKPPNPQACAATSSDNNTSKKVILQYILKKTKK